MKIIGNGEKRDLQFTMNNRSLKAWTIGPSLLATRMLMAVFTQHCYDKILCRMQWIKLHK